MGSPFSPDRVWVTPSGDYLVQGPPVGPFPEFELPPDAGAVARHVLVTPAGTVTRTYSEPRAYAIDWTRGVCNVHAVLGSELRAYHWTEDQSGQGFVELTFEVVLAGLRPVSPDQLPLTAEVLWAATGGE